MKTVCLVQARTGSTRLPGKVLGDLAGRPMLRRVLERLQSCQFLHEIIVATTTLASDDPLIEIARSADCGWFRGSECDVLSRYVGAARQSQADIVVRVTADCPLVEPRLVDQIVTELIDKRADYASNVLERTFVHGVEAEALWTDVLARLDRLGTSASAREHVTTFARWERPDLFRLHSLVDTVDNSDLRWTVDTADDLEYVRRLYEHFDLANRQIIYRELVAEVRRDDRWTRNGNPREVRA